MNVVTRGWRSLIVATAAVCLGATFAPVPGAQAVTAADAVGVNGRQCDASSDPDNDFPTRNDSRSSIPAGTSKPFSGQRRCINGYELNTRGRINAECLTNKKLFADREYGVSECGSWSGRGVERVAHARAVYLLNRAEGFPNSSGISPDIQWETVLTRKVTDPGYDDDRFNLRPDIVFYDHQNPGDVATQHAPVQIAEVRQTDGSDVRAGQAAADLGIYLDAFPRLAGQEVERLGRTEMEMITGDWFSVKFKDDECEPDELMWEKYETFWTPAAEGVIQIRQIERECKDEEAEEIARIEAQEANKHVVDDDITAVPGNILEWFATRYDQTVCKSFGIGGNGLYVAVTAAVFVGAIAAFYGSGAVVAAAAAGGTSTVASSVASSVGLLLSCLLSSQMAGASGDPHLRTLDGLAYDLQSVGEFHLLRDPAHDMDLQVRFSPLGSTGRVSVITSSAFTLGGSLVEIRQNGSVLIDGEPTVLSDNESLPLGDDGAGLVRSGSRIVAIWPSDEEGERSYAIFEGSAVSVSVPEGTSTSGLLGNHNASKNDDLRLKSGALVASTSAAYLHSTYANSWRISDETSAFTYGTGESTETYTDRSYPANLVSVDSFSAADRVGAEATCRDAGVLEGAPMRSCVYDLLVTGQNYFVQSAVSITDVPTMLDEIGFDEDGELSVDFEGAVPSNFEAAKMASDVALSEFAGPFVGGETYGFSVSDVPLHGEVTVGADLTVLGDWDDDDSSQVVKVKVGDHVVWETTVTGDSTQATPQSPELGTPVAAGQTASGAPYWTYRIEFSAPHQGEHLGVVVDWPAGTDHVGRAFAVDNIDAAIDAEDPQEFSLAVTTSPVRVEEDSPGVGAGNVETKSSQDRYQFTVAADTEYLLGWRSCPSGSSRRPLVWQVLNAEGAAVRSGSCGTEIRLEGLAAGAYEFSVFTSNVTTGTYSFDLMEVPDPQEFALTVSETPTRVSQDSPSDGAGHLETIAAIDRYVMTVPAGGRKIVLAQVACEKDFWSGVRWSLRDAGGELVASGDCHDGFWSEMLDAGSYTVQYESDGEHAGAYSFDVMLVPDPQEFEIELTTVPLSISDGTPEAGAGKLETVAARDRYEFDIDADGSALMIDNVDCPTNLLRAGMGWTLRNLGTDAVVAAGKCTDDRVVEDLDTGTYRLEYASVLGLSGAYAVDLLIVPEPDAFDVVIPGTGLSISDGVPGAGAGRIETVVSKDIYRFTIDDPGGTLIVNKKSCPTNYPRSLEWTVRGSDGTVVKDSECLYGDATIPDLEPGDYEFEVRASRGLIGAYEFDVFLQPDPEEFDLTLSEDPLVVSDGVPSPGAGNIESVASRDWYHFTVPAGGRSVMLDNRGCGSTIFAAMPWTVRTEGGDEVRSGACNADALLTDLAAGDYVLEYAAAGDMARPYTFALFFPPAPDEFELTVSPTPTSVSDGVPGPGAGNIENVASIDRYWFTVGGSGGTIILDNKSCPSSIFNALQWQLRSENGVVKTSGACTADATVADMEPGRYVLEFVSSADRVGAYTFDLILQPAPEEFALTLTTAPLSVSNGVPAPGAGNMETVASRDWYTFSVPAGGRSVMLDSKSCPSSMRGGAARWVLHEDSGSGPVVLSSPCNTDKLFENLPQGDYVLEYLSANGKYGAYTFDLYFEPPADEAQLTLSTTPVSVSNGVPSAGLGNLETVASRDWYAFSIPAGGQSVMLDSKWCPATMLGGAAKWVLHEESGTGPVVLSSPCNTDKLFENLPEGDYVLEYASANNKIGVYAFDIFFQL